MLVATEVTMSRRRLWIVLGLLGVLLLAGIGDALAFGGLPLSSDVAETTWTLQSYSNGGTDVPLPTGVRVFVVFHRLGHDFSGSDGCNSYFGTFSSFWPGRLALNNMGQTLIGCQGDVGAFEVRYLADLPRVATYHASSGGLVLRSDDGQVELGYTAGSA
jgi:heat shock protein HslJ